MRRIVFWLAVFGYCCSGWAPCSFGVITPDNPNGGSVQFTVNSSQNVRAISPYIYGINSAVGSTLNIAPKLDRLGGNRWTGYNWETNASNAGIDYINQSDNYLVGGATNTAPGQAARPSLQAAAANNRALIVTVPTAGYVAADANNTSVTAAEAAPSGRWLPIVAKKPGALSLTPNKTDGVVFTEVSANFNCNTSTGHLSGVFDSR